MADEGGKLVLNDRTKGISVDEYIGGSFFYNEGITVDRNTKSFKLGPRLVKTNMNNRNNGYIDKIIDGECMFTRDGYFETTNDFPYSSYKVRGGALYKSSLGYINAIKIGDTYLGIKSNKVDRFIDIYNMVDTNVITTPDLTSATGRTVGSGWAVGPTGAVHTSGGGTATLTQSMTTDGTSLYRIGVRVVGCTTGTCTVKWGTTTKITLSSTSPYREMATHTSTTTPESITLTPSNTFNGRIEYVSVQPYLTASKIFIDENTITSATSHPVCLWQGDVYIGSGSSIDVISVSDRTVSTVNIIDSNYTIQSITQVGGNLIIWANNGSDSKQYYWNGVDETASEVIDWNDIRITNAVSDGATCYVVAYGDTEYSKVYKVDGYSRQMLTNYEYNGICWNDFIDGFGPSLKFNFHLNNSNCIAMSKGNLYVPSHTGIYKYGNDIPGMPAMWSQDISHNVFGITPSEIYAIDTYGDPYYSILEGGYHTFIQTRRYSHNNTGYLVTNPILRDNLSTEKALTKMKIGYKNIKSTYGGIKIYAIVDDFKFFTYNINSGISVEPEIGAIYRDSANQILSMELIAKDMTAGVGTLTFRVLTSSYFTRTGVGELIKISGTGDASITGFSSYNNMVLVKTIESTEPGYYSETIFGQSFIDAYIPNRRKLQLVIELYSSSTSQSPEIYDISILSDIVNQDV